MKRILVKDLKDHLDKEIVVKGWIYNLRSSGSIMFLQFRDGTGFSQVVVEEKAIEASVWQECQKITMESSVSITAVVSKHPKKEEYELQLRGIEVLHVSPEFPISKKEHGPEFLLDNRHLWLRSKTQWAMLRLRNLVWLGLTEFMAKEHCVRIDTPIFTPTSCEDTTELFTVDYFGEPAYLSQSGQLYLEAAEQSVGRCYDFGPVFRSEKSKTRRHLTEFWMMDVELPFENQDEMEVFQENMIEYVVQYVLQNGKQELEILGRDISKLENIKAPFPRITHKEAIDMLKAEGIEKEYTDDLTGAEENMLSGKFDKPVIIKDYPFAVKAFYMKQIVDDMGIERAVCNDMLFPEGYGEVIGGSQREDSVEVLEQRMKDKGYPVEEYQWYLDLRRYGSQEHSGFGIGLERFVLFIAGREHVREAIPFPRMLNRLKP